MHWFERYRLVYADWWKAAAGALEDEELDDFRAFRSSDDLAPVNAEGRQELLVHFPKAPAELLELLTRFGTGILRFPDHDGDFEPAEYQVFPLSEALLRVDSIQEHATRELEELAEFGHDCRIHDDAAQCTALLTGVRDAPHRFYPLFGPTDVYDFVYILQGEPNPGVAARYYHDYPLCELLDGSNDAPSLTAYGEELIRIARSGDANPL